jgi:hypothetical protein
VASEKESGKRKMKEGKDHLEFAAYCVTMRQAVKSKKFNHSLQTFGWCFATLQWCMMSRSVSVASLKLGHFHWKNDSLVITLSKSKSDQAGERTIPKHIYANPINPFICPVLALAVFVFTHSFLPYSDNRHSSKWSLFTALHSASHSQRFGNWLKELLPELSRADKMKFGTSIDEISSHSFRKGAASLCAGMVNGPSLSDVALRGGWMMGVMSRYMFSSTSGGGDHLTGRCLSGLTRHSSDFASLPPRFTDAALKSITKKDWQAILPSYCLFPESFRTVLPFLLASLYIHHSWLALMMGTTHAVLCCKAFTYHSLFERLSKPGTILLGKYNCEISGMQATGVDNDIKILERIDALQQQQQENTDKIMEATSALPTAVVSQVSNDYTIQSHHLTPSALRNIMEEVLQRRDAERVQIVNAAEQAAPTAAQEEKQLESADWPRRYRWGAGEMMKLVPEGFCLPVGISVDTGWNLWIYGNRSLSLPPLHLFHSYDLNRKDAALLCKIKSVVKYLEHRSRKLPAEQGGLPIAEYLENQTDPIKTNQYFRAAMKSFIRCMKKKENDNHTDSKNKSWEAWRKLVDHTKKANLAATTVYNILSKRKRREAAEIAKKYSSSSRRNQSATLHSSTQPQL